jgi:hypothetical protein
MQLPESLWPFIGRTAAWLVPCFAAWYLISPWHAQMPAWLAFHFIKLFQPNLVTDWAYADHLVTFGTTIKVRTAGDQLALLLPEVRALTYTWGLALFVALSLAARARAWTFAAGIALLLPLQAWSIAFDLLMQVGIRLRPDLALQTGLSSGQREFIALGYQLGALILPSLAPVMLWAGFNRKILPMPGTR